jgi:ubiquinone/menaquinone biosynthesis C-methylase UbiE
MEDDVARDKETQLIEHFIRVTAGLQSRPRRVLDAGCGNAFTLERLSLAAPQDEHWGVDASIDMLAVGCRRPAARRLAAGSAQSLPFAAPSFDIVVSQRCLINILDWEGQREALAEIARILRPGGFFLMIEGFEDGLRANNQARRECGLEELRPAHHNLYLEKTILFAELGRWFRVVEPQELDPDEPDRLASNFLSSHYFVARVLYAALNKGEWVRNAEVMKFFSFLPPLGNYSPIQALVLKREDL